MKMLFEQVENIINQEISIINEKIKGTSFLEILKFKILENISKNKFDLSSDNLDEYSKDFNFEDNNKKVSSKLFFCKSPKILLNTNIKKNLLIICFKESIKIDIQDFRTKKHFNYNLIKNTGLTLSKDLNCNFNYLKNVIAIEIYHEDKTLTLENLEKNTI